LLRLEDEQHCCAISGSYLWTTPYPVQGIALSREDEGRRYGS
jgi:hypothetical protein